MRCRASSFLPAESWRERRPPGLGVLVRTCRHRQCLTLREGTLRCEVPQQFVSDVARGRVHDIQHECVLPPVGALRIQPDELAQAGMPSGPGPWPMRLAAHDASEQGWAPKATGPADEPNPALPAPGASGRLAAWPLLILDAGAFLARCRWCGWKSTGQSSPSGAWAAFDAHACEERPT